MVLPGVTLVLVGGPILTPSSNPALRGVNLEVVGGTTLLGPVFFRTALPCSCGYHTESGGMPLHDAVGINCKKGVTTENLGSGVKYIG